MRNDAPDMSLPVVAWNWPCAEETLSALPQFQIPISSEETEQFWNGLSRSLSLTVEEKMRVIQEASTLSETQIRLLAEVWDDELKEFQTLLESEFFHISKLVGQSAIEWLLIWENLGLKKDHQEMGVIWQFVDIFYSGGVIPEFKSYGRNSYFWLGCITAMNKHGRTGVIDRALALLGGTLNDSNLGIPDNQKLAPTEEFAAAPEESVSDPLTIKVRS